MRVAALETIQVGAFPYLIFIRVHTDEGLVGKSDTYYTTDAGIGTTLLPEVPRRADATVQVTRLGDV